MYKPFFSFSNAIWICSAVFIIDKACNVWVAKNSTHAILQNVSQHVVQQQSTLVMKSLKSKIIQSMILTGIMGIIIQKLMLSVFHIGREEDRLYLVVVTFMVCYPIWMWMDRNGRSRLPWSTNIRSILVSHRKQFNTQPSHHSII